MKRDSTRPVSIRNLEDIREDRPSASSSRVGTLIMASFGGACIVFAALALMRSDKDEVAAPADPLGDLIAQSGPKTKKQAARPKLKNDDVSFPTMLSDQPDPPAAMEAVRRRKKGEKVDPPLPEGPAGPPPAADVLPVVPLPAQDMLHSKAGQVPKQDKLAQITNHVSREPIGEMAAAGHAGGYQLQVSSFKQDADAQAFAMALRRRGHRAYVEQAHVKGRGLWHRVRIGPFKYKQSAVIYRQDFEAKERMVTFIVNPPKAKIRLGLR